MANDDAVSAVVGVVLIVAVTFAVSAGIGVYLDHYAEKESLQSVPAVAFAKQESDDLVEVVQAPVDTFWSEYELLADHEVRFALNDAPTMGSPAVAPGGAAALPSSAVMADDRLVLCGADGEAPVAHEGVVVGLRHIESGKLTHSFTFSSIAACWTGAGP